MFHRPATSNVASWAAVRLLSSPLRLLVLSEGDIDQHCVGGQGSVARHANDEEPHRRRNVQADSKYRKPL
jgi:hypothetical protein